MAFLFILFSKKEEQHFFVFSNFSLLGRKEAQCNRMSMIARIVTRIGRLVHGFDPSTSRLRLMERWGYWCQIVDCRVGGGGDQTFSILFWQQILLYQYLHLPSSPPNYPLQDQPRAGLAFKSNCKGRSGKPGGEDDGWLHLGHSWNLVHSQGWFWNEGKIWTKPSTLIFIRGID